VNFAPKSAWKTIEVLLACSPFECSCTYCPIGLALECLGTANGFSTPQESLIYECLIPLQNISLSTVQTLPWFDRWCCSVLTKPFLDLIGGVAWCSPRRHHWQKYAGHHCLQSVWRRSSTTHAKVHNLNSWLNPSCSKYFQHCTQVLLSGIVNCNSYFMWYQNASGCCMNLLECSQLEEKNVLWSFWPSTAWRSHKSWGGAFVVVCRCWYGYYHVVKNNCTQWGMYAVGGSEAPTINSEGNR
jgi:hypothetical protein